MRMSDISATTSLELCSRRLCWRTSSRGSLPLSSCQSHFWMWGLSSPRTRPVGGVDDHGKRRPSGSTWCPTASCATLASPSAFYGQPESPGGTLEGSGSCRTVRTLVLHEESTIGSRDIRQDVDETELPTGDREFAANSFASPNADFGRSQRPFDCLGNLGWILRCQNSRVANQLWHATNRGCDRHAPTSHRLRSHIGKAFRPRWMQDDRRPLIQGGGGFVWHAAAREDVRRGLQTCVDLIRPACQVEGNLGEMPRNLDDPVPSLDQSPRPALDGSHGEDQRVLAARGTESIRVNPRRQYRRLHGGVGESPHEFPLQGRGHRENSGCAGEVSFRAPPVPRTGEKAISGHVAHVVAANHQNTRLSQPSRDPERGGRMGISEPRNYDIVRAPAPGHHPREGPGRSGMVEPAKLNDLRVAP